MLIFYAETSNGLEGRLGCLVAGAAMDLTTLDAEIGGRVTAALQRVEVLLLDLVRLGQADGSIPVTVNPGSCARTLLCLVQGLRVVGKVGRTRDELESVVRQAMRLLT